ncbi:MAG: methyltransferase domain-containing protein [Alphaproteobacteria bacterium]|nr:methyltransferase domain-containing protein [Alphaproteobacteria bacterium]MCB9929918.1 methyltransferase domain-containing protein [Alphaproteobacteria bacterium]
MNHVAENEKYRKEYNSDFVSRWDDLIGWDGREEGERQFFERILNIHEVKTVADIASGTGYHAIKLAHAGFEVTATDGAATMLEQTKANAERMGIALADAQVVDWRKLSDVYGANHFDALVCLGNAFTHLYEHEARRDALAAMYAVLKPGGILLLDHRNYDSILDQGFSSKHKFYYTGDETDVRPVRISRTEVKFEYDFGQAGKHYLTLYPLRQNYVQFLLEDAGFVDITRYGDFERPFEHYDPDFIQQVAFKPQRTSDGVAPRPRNTGVAKVVEQTKRYYDGAADTIYREIWGENIHLGLFEEEGESLQDANARTNKRLAALAGLSSEQTVLEVGCGYGATARFLAETVGCNVVATNISDRELAEAKRLTEAAGLGDKVRFAYGDFHALDFPDDHFDVYWCQESFLHAADKEQVLREAYRVLKPAGRFVLTELLVREGTPDDIRERVYERVGAPIMWDAPDYRQTLQNLGFRMEVEEDWSPNVARTYGWVREQLEARRPEFEDKIGRDLVDRTSRALQFWVDTANDGCIGWHFFIADKVG